MSHVEISLTVTPEDGDPYMIKADARDMYTWEKTTPNKHFNLQQVLEEMRFLELYRIAWIAARRQGMYSGTLDDFAANCIVEPGEDEDDEPEPDPTQPAPSAGPSSLSPSSQGSRQRSGQKRATGRS